MNRSQSYRYINVDRPCNNYKITGWKILVRKKKKFDYALSFQIKCVFLQAETRY